MAARLWEAAAEQGSALASLRLGDALLRDGATLDAVAMYSAASDRGSAEVIAAADRGSAARAPFPMLFMFWNHATMPCPQPIYSQPIHTSTGTFASFPSVSICFRQSNPPGACFRLQSGRMRTLTVGVAAGHLQPGLHAGGET